MFVIFEGGGIKKIRQTFRVSEDMPVEAPQVTDALNKVQLAVEEKYRDIRGQILDFDDVLNDQRGSRLQVAFVGGRVIMVRHLGRASLVGRASLAGVMRGTGVGK